MRRQIFSSANLYIIAAALILSFSYSSFAQEITGTLVGTVRDNSGSIVPGATVTITDSQKNTVVRTVTTDDEGNFSAPNLNVGVYSVSVEVANFKKSVQTDVKLDVGQRRSVDFSLEAGRIEEVVTVEAESVSVDLVSPTSGTVINGDQVRELSVNNRNFTQLVALAPGVSSDLSDQVYVGTTNPEGQANTVQLSVNGARSSQNTFTVDGADITDRGSNLTIQAYPSIDSIGEFRVLRSLYPAESGRSGGGQVNVVTRSGTSEFRGNAFEFIRNEAFNANNFFNNLQTNPQFGRDEEGRAKRAPFRYNNFGWTLGGPIYFLRFGEAKSDESFFKKWDRTFFFFSQEFRKDNRFAAPNVVTVADANLRAGIFPFDVCIRPNNQNCDSYVTALNPNGGRLQAGVPLPANLINPAAAAYLRDIYSFIPLPNAATANSPYNASFSLPNKFDFRQEILKIDHSFNEKWQAYYRFQKDNIPSVEGNGLFSSGSGLPNVSTTETNSPGKTHTLQSTYSFTPNTILELRYTYSYGAILSNAAGLLALTNSNIPITLPFVNQRDRVPTLTGNGFTGLTSFGPYDNFSDKHNYTGSFTWILGNHTMKFGAVYSMYRKNENALAGNNEGLFGASAFSSTVAPAVTGANPLPATPNTTINQNRQRWANFLTGNVAANGFTQAKFDYTADLRQKAFEGYVQDEWRFRPNLTLYMGVRYSFFGAPWDKNGRLTNFDPRFWDPAQAPQVNGAGNRVAGTGNNCNGLIANAQNFTTGPANFNCRPTPSPYGKFVWKANKTDFAPRVGLAWDPFGDGKTSIRTGYGIYHEQILNGPLLQNIGLNPPYQETFTNPTVTRLDNPGGGVGGAPLVQSLRAIQTELDTPYMQHWSFDVQRQLTSNTIFTIGYYGSKGTNLIGLTDINLIPVGKARVTPCINAAGTPLPACQPAGYVFRNLGTSVTNPNNPNATSNDILILDQIRPYRGYRSIAMVESRYNSNYHSMQMFLQHRFSGASQINVAYTWSKNLTDSQNDRTASPQDTYDIRSEYSRAALDRRHIFNLNYVYELPWFDKQNDLVGKILGGWQASGIITYNTGLGFTAVTSNFDPGGTGIINANPTARPYLVCDPNANAPHTVEQWFNTACFSTSDADAAANGYLPGDAQRNIIEGPATFRVDFTMMKNIRFGERFRLQLRAEAFNIFNKTNFRSFASLNTTALAFGDIGGARDPRTMQFGIKFYF